MFIADIFSVKSFFTEKSSVSLHRNRRATGVHDGHEKDNMQR